MAGHAGSAYATANLTWNQTNVGQQYWGEPDIHPQWCQQCAFVDKDNLTKAQGRCIRAGHDHVAQRTDPAPRNRGARGRAPDPPPISRRLLHVGDVAAQGRVEGDAGGMRDCGK